MRAIIRWGILIAGILVLSLSSITGAKEEHRIALVIGNSAYKNSPLRNPVNDSQDMAKVLESLGFEVIHKQNADRRTMILAIDEFGRKLRKADVGLFFYAGHGVQVKGRNYLIPLGAHVTVERDVELESVDSWRVLGQMEAADNRINIIILDACRNNPFARSYRSGTRGLARMDAPKGSYIAFATAPGSVAGDGPGRNGVFTHHLLKNIPAPGLKIEEVMKLTRIGVAGVTGEKQLPWDSSSLMGDFYFNPKKVATQLEPAPIKEESVKLPSKEKTSFDDILKAEQEQREAKEKWKQWQRAREAEYQEVLKIDKSEHLTANHKAVAWERFFAVVSQDNPYSQQDDDMRASSQNRISRWKEMDRAEIRRKKLESEKKLAYIPQKKILKPPKYWRGIKLKYSNFLPPGHPQSKAASNWVEEVKKRTDGKVQITYYPGGSLIRANQAYDGVVKGISDLGLSAFAYSRDRFSVMRALDLPLAYPNGRIASRVAYDFLKDIKPKEVKDVKVLYVHAHGPSILHTKFPVKTLDNLRGMKIRGSSISHKLLKALGAVPVALPMAETYMALERGVVDGVFTPIETLKGFRLAKVINYIVECYSIGYTTTFFVVMNLDKWNRLPDSVKEFFEDMSNEWVDVHGKAWQNADLEGKKYAISLGKHFITLSDHESSRWSNAAESVIRDYTSKVPNGNTYVRKIRELINKHSKIR